MGTAWLHIHSTRILTPQTIIRDSSAQLHLCTPTPSSVSHTMNSFFNPSIPSATSTAIPAGSNSRGCDGRSFSFRLKLKRHLDSSVTAALLQRRSSWSPLNWGSSVCWYTHVADSIKGKNSSKAGRERCASPNPIRMKFQSPWMLSRSPILPSRLLSSHVRTAGKDIPMPRRLTMNTRWSTRRTCFRPRGTTCGGGTASMSPRTRAL